MVCVLNHLTVLLKSWCLPVDSKHFTRFAQLSYLLFFPFVGAFMNFDTGALYLYLRTIYEIQFLVFVRPIVRNFLPVPVVLLLIHSVSYPDFRTDTDLVQYLFFKQDLITTYQNFLCRCPGLFSR